MHAIIGCCLFLMTMAIMFAKLFLRYLFSFGNTKCLNVFSKTPSCGFLTVSSTMHAPESTDLSQLQ